MATNPEELKMIEEVRRWRREAYEQWRSLSPAQRDDETRRSMDELGLRFMEFIPEVPPREGMSYADRLEAVREEHPRAYEKWPPEEDESLANLFRSGLRLDEIAQRLQRQPSAIRSRLVKLGLVA